MHRLAVAATAAILIAHQSHAQTTNNLMRSLSKIELVIEDLKDHHRACGLTDQAIRAAVMFPLSSARIEVVSSAPAFLYVNVNTLYLASVDWCVSAIHMQVHTRQTVTFNFSGEEKRAAVELWNGGSINSSARVAHPRQLSAAVEEHTKKFITDWNLDNRAQPRPAPPQPETITESAVALGTGFAVTPTGDLITNEHVVSKCSTVTVKQGNRKFSGTVSFKDRVADLALIHLNWETPASIPADLLPPPPFAALRQSPAVKPGEQVIAYGFPLRGALADEGNLTIGNVSAMRGLNNDPNEIQISAPVQPGNSGGPLLDSSGNVIGVVASKLDALNALARTGDLPQNVNFAISLPVLKAFLARSGVRATESASRVELRPDEIGDRAKSFTYAIECDPRAVVRAVEQKRVDVAALDAAIARGRSTAQKAVLYEEDQTTDGTQFIGSVVWRTERVTPGPGQKPDVVVRAEIEIPEQNVSVRLAMRRNDDKSLAATHTVEIVFTLPPDFPHGGISNILGILLKQGETTRGLPLNGVAVKVATNFFMIGLSSVEVDMQRNVQLLKERPWFDIPVVYGDGKRAIIAIEKGAPGDRAFAEASRAWGDLQRGKAAAPPKAAAQPAR